MDNLPSFEPIPAPTTEPFTLVALASTDLNAGEMVHFDVDSAGNITSPNFTFVATTPRLGKIAALQVEMHASVTVANQSESIVTADVSPAAPRQIREPEPTGLNLDRDATIASKTSKVRQDRIRRSTQGHGASAAEASRAVKKGKKEKGSVRRPKL